MQQTNIIQHRLMASTTTVLVLLCLALTHYTARAQCDAIASWSFDGSLNDCTGNGHTLTPYLSPTFITTGAKILQSGRLSGGNSSYGSDIHDIFQDFSRINSEPFTWVGWFKRNAAPLGGRAILIQTRAVNNGVTAGFPKQLTWYQVGSSGYLTGIGYNRSPDNFVRTKAAIINPMPYTVGEWYFIVYGMNGTHTFLEVNRSGMVLEEIPTTGGASSPNVYPGTIELGPWQQVWCDQSFDEIALYRRVLSSTELDALYNAGAGRRVCPQTVSISAIDNVAWENGTYPNTPTDLGKFRISRTGGLGCPLQVYFTTGGTAIKSPSFDYGLSAGSPVTIPAGSAYVDVDLFAYWDGASSDPGETAIMTLSANAGYSIGSPSSATVYIYDCPTPTVSIAAQDNSAAENQSDPGNPTNLGVFRISRTGSTGCPLLVHFSTSGTAINSPSMDYSLSTESPVVIPAGSSYVDIFVYPWWDGYNDAGETSIMTLFPSADYSIGSPSSNTVYIYDF